MTRGVIPSAGISGRMKEEVKEREKRKREREKKKEKKTFVIRFNVRRFKDFINLVQGLGS
jgi:negative regulator of genetic competence, sporulation and motility